VTAIRDRHAGWQAAGKPSRSEQKGRATIGSYRVEQRQIIHHGRVFHFVSYDGQPGNAARGQPATLAAWFLMSAGTRWEVAPQIVGEEPAATDRRLLEWITLTITKPTGKGP